MRLSLILLVISFCVTGSGGSCVMGGKSASSKLNDVLAREINSNELKANVEASKTFLNNAKDKETRNFVRDFIKLEEITEENLCDDKSIDLVDSLTSKMRRDSPDAFKMPKLGRKLNSLVAEVARRQLQSCAPKLTSEWERSVDKEKLEAEYDSLKYFANGLRQGSTEGHMPHQMNRWLLKQSGKNVYKSAHSLRALDGALRVILKRDGRGPIIHDGELYMELIDEKISKPCREFAGTQGAEILGKLLKVLRSGNIEEEQPEGNYYGLDDSVEWAMRLEACERLLQSKRVGFGRMIWALVMDPIFAKNS